MNLRLHPYSVNVVCLGKCLRPSAYNSKLSSSYKAFVSVSVLQLFCLVGPDFFLPFSTDSRQVHPDVNLGASGFQKGSIHTGHCGFVYLTKEREQNRGGKSLALH